MTNLTLRSVKGSPLTNNEVDTNFSNLDSDKVEQTAPTGSIKAPSGTTAQRDGAPVNGYFRYNATSHSFEGYINGSWSDIGLTYSAGNGIDLTGTTFSVAAGGGLTQDANGLSHTDTSTQASLTALTGANVVSDIDLDTYGHVTALATRAMTAGDIGAATSGHNHTLDSLSNVTITTNSSGEILKWSGTAWINNTLAEAGIQPAGSYLTGNETITLSGDVTGSGTTAITTSIAANVVGANELNVTGNGTSSQFLRSDGDGTFTWATPTDTVPNNGTLTLATSGTGLSGSASFTADQAGNSTFTVTSNATSTNTASTIVARDASGNFTAGTITATLSGNATTATTASGVTANSVALGTDTTGNYVATISGTANEIEVTGSGAETAAVTIGLPNDVTIGNDLTVSGNLTVSGTTTTVNTEEINLADNIIRINSNQNGLPSEDGGIEIERGNQTNVLLKWNETTDRWEFTNDGTTYYNIPLSTEYSNYTHPSHPGDDIDVDTGPLTGATVVSDIDINVTTDALGHVTDANGVIATRTLTLADLGYTGDNDAEANQNAFSNFAVSGQTTVAADAKTDTVTFVAGTNVSITTNATTDTITFNATDTNTTYSAGNGIGLTGTTFSVAAGGGLTQDAGGLSHTDTSTQASLTALTGANVVSDIDLDTYGHVTSLATRAMTLSDLGYTGDNDAEANQNAFSNFAVSGQSTVAADAKTDTVTFVAGTNVTITTNAGTDTITFSAAGGADTLQDIAADATNVDQYITFVPNTTGAQTGRVDAGLRYNPSTNVLKIDKILVGTDSDDGVSKIQTNGTIQASDLRLSSLNPDIVFDDSDQGLGSRHTYGTSSGGSFMFLHLDENGVNKAGQPSTGITFHNQGTFFNHYWTENRFYTMSQDVIDQSQSGTSDLSFGSILIYHDDSDVGTTGPDALIIENRSSGPNADVVFGLLCNANGTTNTAYGEIRFGDGTDISAGYIRYTHNANPDITFAVENDVRAYIDVDGLVADKLTVSHPSLPVLEFIDEARATTERAEIIVNQYGGMEVHCDPTAVSPITTNFDVYVDNVLKMRIGGGNLTAYGDIIMDEANPRFYIRDINRTSTQEALIQGDTNGGIQIRADNNSTGSSPDIEFAVRGVDKFRTNERSAIFIADGSIEELDYINAAVTGSLDLDPTRGSRYQLTLTGNTTFTESINNGEFILVHINDGTGFTVTWPTITWVNNAGISPTLSTTVDTVVSLWQINNTLYGALVGDGT